MSAKILIVDDDEEFIDDLIFFLNSDYEFVSAANSRQALQILTENSVNLVLLDLGLPAFLASTDEAEGLALLRYIRKMDGLESLPVIIITGSGTPEKRARCEELGVCGFLTKPLAVSDLRDLIKKVNR